MVRLLRWSARHEGKNQPNRFVSHAVSANRIYGLIPFPHDKYLLEAPTMDNSGLCRSFANKTRRKPGQAAADWQNGRASSESACSN